MKKRILAMIMAATLTFGTTATAFAYGSITNEVVSVDDKIVVEQKLEESDFFKEIQQKAPETASLIETVNKLYETSTEGNEGKEAVKLVVEELQKKLETLEDEDAKKALELVIEKLETKELITGFVNVKVEGDVEKNENGNYEATISVPTLTDQLEGVEILHYNIELDTWEILIPEIDNENNALTFEFKEENALIAILADELKEDTEADETENQ